MEETGYFYSEKDFRNYFEQHLDKFGVKKIQLSHEACPDYVLIMENGQILNAEAELFADQFKYDHKDQLNLVDVVLCCYAKSNKVLGKPAIALHKLYELDDPNRKSSLKQLNTKLSKEEQEMLEFVGSYGRISFVQLSGCEQWSGDYLLFQNIPPNIAKGALRGYPEDCTIFDIATRDAIKHMRKYCNVMLAANLSKKACEIFDNLRRKELVCLVPSCFAVYLMDGGVMYDPKIWIPMEIQITKKALENYKDILVFRRFLQKEISSIAQSTKNH